MPLTGKKYRISDFGGGLNTRVASHLLHEKEAQVFQNLTLSAERGLIKRRNGYTKYNSSQIDANPITGLHRYYKRDGTKHFVIGSGTKIYKASGSTLNASTLASGFTSGAGWFFDTIDDVLIAANGVDATQRFDGTTMRDAGFPAPTASCAAVAGSGTTMTGTYKYVVTFIYDDASEESSVGPEMTSGVTVSGQGVDLSDIPLGNASCTQRNIYRTEDGGILYYYLATIDDNTTTTYHDTATDADLDLADLAPDDNGVPPICKYVASFANRMWYANLSDNPSRIMFSAITESEASSNVTGTQPSHGAAGAEIVPSDFWIDVNDDDGDEITGLGVTLDSMIIFKEKSIWRIVGSDPSNFELQKANTDMGCIAPRTIAKVETLLYFLTGGDKPSIAATDGINTIPIGERIQPTLEGDIDRTTLETACAVRYRYNYVLLYKPTSASNNLNGFVHDYTKDVWGRITNIPAAMFSVWDGSDDGGKCYFGDATAGNVFQYDSGASDNGSDIVSIWQSKFHDFNAPENRKIVKKIQVMAYKSDDSVVVDLLRDINTSVKNSETKTFDVSAADPTDGLLSPCILTVANGARGRLISVKVSSTGTDSFAIYSLMIIFDEMDDGN